MRKVIGIGETIFDIIFKNNQPIGAVPGGSAFNGVISLGRSGVDCSFISDYYAENGRTVQLSEYDRIGTDFVVYRAEEAG